MALRARLSPPREEQIHWPWHKAKCLTLPASALWSGERRMEAENFLSSGYGQRLALAAKVGDGSTLGSVARIWQPSRLKGITVSKEFGTPFLAATQAFDSRPVPRKFLSLSKTEDSITRFVSPGNILVTCSGSVGRATLATAALSGLLISHDLLRIEPAQPELWGWAYAFLRSPVARAMMGSSKYGHIIKHLEPSHLAGLPMPCPTSATAARLQTESERVLAARNAAVALMIDAENLFTQAIGELPALDFGESGFTVKASTLMTGRRRLEGIFSSPAVEQLNEHFRARQLRTSSLKDAGFDVWLPTRFRRIPAEEGVKLVGSADLFEINPDLEKRIADINFGDRNAGRVKRGWLLLARSGQTYGLNGTLAIANAFHEGKIVSDHVIRIAPTEHCNARAGYVYMALSHPNMGRPLVKSLAYGSSIPEIDPGDIASLRFPRLDGSVEGAIAEKAEEAAKLFAEADILENDMAKYVDRAITDLLAGRWDAFVKPSEDAADIPVARRALSELEEHPERMLRGAALEEKMKQWEA